MKTNKKARITAILMAVMMVFALTPLLNGQKTYADEGTPAIQFVTNGNASNIVGAQGSNVFFGNYPQSSDGNDGFIVEPIKWRVLRNADGRLFLLSDSLLDWKRWNEEPLQYATWETCSLRAWLNGSGDDSFINNAFSAKEKTAIFEVEVINEENPDSHVTSGDNTYDKIYLLSVGEAIEGSFGFPTAYGSENTTSIERTGYSTAYAARYSTGGSAWDSWWLRTSAKSGSKYTATVIYPRGYVSTSGLEMSASGVLIRPVFNLNMNSVLFSSAAEGGKNCSVGPDALTEVENYTENDWKLTLLDDGSTTDLNGHKDFAVDSATTCDGKTINVEYHGAATGKNEFISAIIVDSNGNIKCYGRVKTCSSASDTAVINTGGLLGNNDKLYVFNEQYNGDKRTDYASGLKEINMSEIGHAEETVVQKATLAKDGSIVKKCSMCGAVFSKQIISHPKTFKLSSASYTYNGSTKKPTVTVTDANGKAIAASNYTVTYSNNVKAGTAKATVTFKGNYYTGTKSLTFTINKAANSLAVKAKTATVKFKKLKKKNQTLAVDKVLNFTNKGQGTLTYTKASGNKKITINKTTGKVTVKKGLKKKIYKVTVKVSAAGNANYKALAVKKVTFKVKVK